MEAQSSVLIRYMAPEMIKKRGHDLKVDYYGMGALLYEMVYGYPPFYTQDTNKMFKDILQKKVIYPDDIAISPDLKMLLSEFIN